jgi:SsrA-binding protein
MADIKKERTTIFTNKKALHNYHILEDYETGIVLSGYEVKSARLHNVSLTDSLVRITKGEAFLENAYIAPYSQISTHIQDYNAKRLRKLLLHKKEIIKLASKVKEKGLTIVPLELYVSKYGKIKLSIGLAKGKTTYDKKELLKKKDIEREMQKSLRDF